MYNLRYLAVLLASCFVIPAFTMPAATQTGSIRTTLHAPAARPRSPDSLADPLVPVSLSERAGWSTRAAFWRSSLASLRLPMASWLLPPRLRYASSRLSSAARGNTFARQGVATDRATPRRNRPLVVLGIET